MEKVFTFLNSFFISVGLDRCRQAIDFDFLFQKIVAATHVSWDYPLLGIGISLLYRLKERTCLEAVLQGIDNVLV